jgi:hypothetical protein
MDSQYWKNLETQYDVARFARTLQKTWYVANPKLLDADPGGSAKEVEIRVTDLTFNMIAQMVPKSFIMTLFNTFNARKRISNN